jgi:ketosteroid isomerase-like protein
MMNDFIIADCGIRQLYARFSDVVWRKDRDGCGECFAQDGEWKLAGLHVKGRAEICATFSKLLGACERVLLIMGTPLLQVDGNTASGRVHVTELTRMADGSSAMTIGVYYDRYVQQGDRWYFQWRHFSLHYRGPTDLSAALVASPDYGPPPGMPAHDEPTLTRRKLSD